MISLCITIFPVPPIQPYYLQCQLIMNKSILSINKKNIYISIYISSQIIPQTIDYEIVKLILQQRDTPSPLHLTHPLPQPLHHNLRALELILDLPPQLLALLHRDITVLQVPIEIILQFLVHLIQSQSRALDLLDRCIHYPLHFLSDHLVLVQGGVVHVDCCFHYLSRGVLCQQEGFSYQIEVLCSIPFISSFILARSTLYRMKCSLINAVTRLCKACMKDSTNPKVQNIAIAFPLLSPISFVNISMESPSIMHICTFKVFMAEENCSTFQNAAVAKSMNATKEGMNSTMNTTNLGMLLSSTLFSTMNLGIYFRYLNTPSQAIMHPNPTIPDPLNLNISNTLPMIWQPLPSVLRIFQKSTNDNHSSKLNFLS